MSILTRPFDLSQASEAFGIPVQTIHSWRRRGYVRDMQGTGGQGRPVALSFFSTMRMGIAWALLSVGLPESKAFAAAMHFSDAGEGPLLGRPGRIPGLPFHHDHGDTHFHFAASTDRTWEGTQVTETIGSIKHHLGNPVSFVTVDVSAVFYRLCGVLGLHPFVVLDEEYAAFPDGDEGQLEND